MDILHRMRESAETVVSLDGDLAICSWHAQRQGLKTIYGCSLLIGMTNMRSCQSTVWTKV